MQTSRAILDKIIERMRMRWFKETFRLVFCKAEQVLQAID